MVWFALTLVLMLGLSTLCWGTVGLLRRIVRDRHLPTPGVERLRSEDVAVIIAARNEELVLGATLVAVTRIVEPRQVFVVSDASTDRTAEVARQHGARVMELVTNRGKAGALVAGLRHFDLRRRFAVVMLLDADTHPAEDYLSTGLPLFDDPGTVAVAGTATTLWDEGPTTWIGRALLTYRERTYVAVQTLHKYGQAAHRADAVAIVPGFASMYRSTILGEIEIDAPGLAIEDYNMTFEVHAKRLGRVAFEPASARAYTQDPVTVREYAGQMSRWGLGFWQTLLRHRLQARVFWASVTVFALEVLISSMLLMVVMPVVVFVALVNVIAAVMPIAVPLAEAAAGVPVAALVLGVVIPDLVLTLYVAAVTRRVRYLGLAPCFPLIRLIDAFVVLRALIRALRGSSTGLWLSPSRRAGTVLTSGPALMDTGDQL